MKKLIVKIVALEIIICLLLSFALIINSYYKLDGNILSQLFSFFMYVFVLELIFNSIPLTVLALLKNYRFAHPMFLFVVMIAVKALVMNLFSPEIFFSINFLPYFISSLLFFIGVIFLVFSPYNSYSKNL